MKTKNLINLISKYSISDVDSVKYVVVDSAIQIEALNGKRNCRYSIKMKNTDLQDGVFGIYDSKTLKAVLGVLGDDILVKYNKVDNSIKTLEMKDSKGKTVSMVTSDLSILDEVKPFKGLPDDFNVVIKITDEFISDFSKSMTALSVENITIPAYSDKSKISMLFGLVKNSNTNKIELSLTEYLDVEKSKDEVTSSLTFDGKTLLQILSANKDVDGTLKIHDDLMMIDYDNDEFENKYVLVALRD